MYPRFTNLDARPPCFLRLFTIGFTFAGLMASTAMATELGASVYPAGVETVMPGMTPAPGGTMFLEFDDFYQANALLNSQGHSEIPGFHLRVAAFAVKVVHNWGLHVLGGTLVSYAALPYLYEHLDGPSALAPRPASAIRTFNRSQSPISAVTGTGGTGWMSLRRASPTTRPT